MTLLQTALLAAAIAVGVVVLVTAPRPALVPARRLAGLV
jgi:hypothetical protein